MANIYSPPKDMDPAPEWDGDLDWDENMKAEEDWIDRLRTLIRETHGKRDYIGDVIQEPVADGHAQYMIASLRPLNLIYLPLGDGYHFRWAKNWKVGDVKQMADSLRSAQYLFGSKVP